MMSRNKYDIVDELVSKKTKDEKTEFLKSLTDEEFNELCSLDTVVQAKIYWAQLRKS